MATLCSQEKTIDTSVWILGCIEPSYFVSLLILPLIHQKTISLLEKWKLKFNLLQRREMKVPHHQIVALQKNTISCRQITSKKCSFTNRNRYQITAGSVHILCFIIYGRNCSVLLSFASVSVTVKEINMFDKFHFKGISL